MDKLSKLITGKQIRDYACTLVKLNTILKITLTVTSRTYIESIKTQEKY